MIEFSERERRIILELLSFSVAIKNPSQELKNLFVLKSYDSLERLKGKTGDSPFLKVQSGKITV